MAIFSQTAQVADSKPRKTSGKREGRVTLNVKADGYRGVSYILNKQVKYGGGLGTYCAKHKPFAVYRPEVKKTFFCYGGGTKKSNKQLVHMVSYYDHKRKVVPRPTLLLDKKTSDAHDNPVISVDDDGYIWIFSTSHGLSRPSYIHRSIKPYDIETFELIEATCEKNGKRVPLNNFSYFQVWHTPQQGFSAFFTHYKDPVDRTLFFISSPDGRTWSEWTRLAAFGKGHYQVTASGNGKICTAFNYHPPKGGLDRRTNLYYLESRDNGKTWQTAGGEDLKLPVKRIDSPSLVHDYLSAKRNVYLKDVRIDAKGRPSILVVTSGGSKPGKANDPRTWELLRWSGKKWDRTEITSSDHNYDMGSLYLEDENTWRIIAPTLTGPQAYATGGEMAMWLSEDSGESWQSKGALTQDSPRNHTYARHPVNAHPDFYAFWADGNGVKESISNLYFCNKAGDVFALPRTMKGDTAKPEKLSKQ